MKLQPFKHTRTKIKQVFLPYVALLGGLILGYGLFRWGLDIKLGWLPWPDAVAEVIIPMLLLVGGIFLVMARRVKLLEVGGKLGNDHFTYQMLFWVAGLAPLIISQVYLGKTSYQVIPVADLAEVWSYPQGRYFEIEGYGVATKQCFSEFEARQEGKYGQELSFYLVFACRFQGEDAAWYGVSFQEKINNRKSETYKQTRYRQFFDSAVQVFKQYDFYEHNLFEKARYADRRAPYLAAIQRERPDISGTDQLILLPMDEAPGAKQQETLWYFWLSTLICLMLTFCLSILPPLNQNAWKKYQRGASLKEKAPGDIWPYFTLGGPIPATAVLFWLNVGIFLLMLLLGVDVFSPAKQQLMDWGGMRQAEVFQGGYWRMLSALFLHLGPYHLIGNVISLGLAGFFLEQSLGSRRFLGIYFLTGLVAALVSLWWHPDSVIVGASGAIFGSFGTLLFFQVLGQFDRETRSSLLWLLVLVVGVNLLLG